MNPWGFVLILMGVVLVYIGIKGTENGVYAFIAGHAMSAYNNTPFAPGSQTKTLNPLTFNPGTTGARVVGPQAVSAVDRLDQSAQSFAQAYTPA